MSDTILICIVHIAQIKPYNALVPSQQSFLHCVDREFVQQFEYVQITIKKSRGWNPKVKELSAQTAEERWAHSGVYAGYMIYVMRMLEKEEGKPIWSHAAIAVNSHFFFMTNVLSPQARLLQELHHLASQQVQGDLKTGPSGGFWPNP